MIGVRKKSGRVKKKAENSWYMNKNKIPHYVNEREKIMFATLRCRLRLPYAEIVYSYIHVLMVSTRIFRFFPFVLLHKHIWYSNENGTKILPVMISLN